MPEDLPTIAEAARLIDARQLSPVELTDALIARIEALDPQLNAFSLPTPNSRWSRRAAAEARDHGRQLPRPDARHPLRLKDIYCTAGIRTTGHSKLAHRPRARPRTPPPSPSCTKPARCCWASSRRTSSPMAGRPSTCPGRRRATRGTRRTSPADRPAAPAPRSRPGLCSARWAPIPAARSATRRRLRHRRAEADLWAASAGAASAQLLQLRPCRADDLDRRGLRASCCRRSPGTTRRTRPAPSAPCRTTAAALTGDIRACASASCGILYEDDVPVPRRRPRGAGRGVRRAARARRDAGGRAHPPGGRLLRVKITTAESELYAMHEQALRAARAISARISSAARSPRC